MNPAQKRISVVIPARNEEYFLPKCLDALNIAAAEVKDLSWEVIVVVNRCTDRTEEIAAARGCVVVKNESKNLSKIRNAGAKIAKGEVLVTLDADSLVSPKILSEILRKMNNPKVVGGGVAMFPDRWSLGIACTMLPLIFMALWYRISGGMFFLRRADFEAIKGFDESLSSAEDVDFARRLRAYGKMTGRRFTTIWRAYLVTSCRKFDILGDWFALKNPVMVYRLFKGRDQESANMIWYDIKRSSNSSEQLDSSSDRE